MVTCQCGEEISELDYDYWSELWHANGWVTTVFERSGQAIHACTSRPRACAERYAS